MYEEGEIHLGEEQQRSSALTKDKLTSTPILTLLDFDLLFELKTRDRSCFETRRKGVLEYFSEKLSDERIGQRMNKSFMEWLRLQTLGTLSYLKILCSLL